MRNLIITLINAALAGLMWWLLGGNWGDGVKWALRLAIGLLALNFLVGWVNVLRAEWRMRFPRPSDGEEEDPDMALLEERRKDPRFKQRVGRVRAELGDAGVSDEDRREQQTRLRRFLGGR